MEPVTRHEFDMLKDMIVHVEGQLEKIWEKVDKMSHRPSWGVVVLVTILSNLVVGLILFVMRN